MMYLKDVLIWYLLFNLSMATIVVDFDEDFRDCGNGLPFSAIDFSNFHIIPEEDGSTTLNGSFRFLEDFSSPMRWRFYSERLERGEWKQAFLYRDVPNVCPLLQIPTELWYPYTRLLKQKTCPFKAGHEERIGPTNIGNFAEMFHTPASFMGEWRVYYESTVIRKGKRVTECLLILFTITEATLSLVFYDDFLDCGNGKPMVGMDYSNFQVLPQDDGSVTLNGSVKFTKDYESPTKWNLYTERLERGTWVPGIVAREVPNICMALQMPTEVWYPYTRLLKQKTCPYRAGHVERVDNINIGNYAALFKVPPDFIGEWRMYYGVVATRKGKRYEECMMMPVTVTEV